MNHQNLDYTPKLQTLYIDSCR